MRYGICTGIENAGLVKKLGYDYIELSVTKTMGLDPAAYAAGKKALEESGIEAECFNILFPKTMNFVDGKTTNLDALEAYLEKAMAMIADLHGKVVVFGSGKCRTCPPEVKYLDAYENLVKACRLTGEIAGRYGIRVVIEPLSRKETNMVCTVTEGALLQKDVANENVGLLADYFHICANHDDINSIATIKDFGHIHIASGNGRRYPLPGDGENYGELFAALHTAGYNDRMSIEGKTENIEQDGAAALAYLNSWRRKTMADKVKLGIIGYGHIGSQHGRAIRDGKCPQVNLTAVCDIDPARLELAKRRTVRTFRHLPMHPS